MNQQDLFNKQESENDNINNIIVHTSNLNINNNNENNSIFINLPFILMKKIVNALEDDLDRICMSLVCKRWFYQRDKYLSFNCSGLMQSFDHFDNQNNRYFTLNSFKLQFQRDINQKSNCTFLLTALPDEFPINYIKQDDILFSIDYQVEIGDFKYDDIKSSCFKMVINCPLINKSGINAIKKSTISSITFIFNYRSKIRLPSNIKEIISLNEIYQSILPLELEVLEYRNRKGRISIDIPTLPRSLKVLKVKLDNFKFICFGIFPPNLEVLKLVAIGSDYEKYTSFSEFKGPLPSTLKHISIPTSWLRFIKHLESIESLKLDQHIGTSIEIGDIPLSVTHLTINSYANRFIGDFSIDTNLFFSFKQLETLDLSGWDFYYCYFQKSVIGELPSSLTKLYLPYDFNEPLRKHPVLSESIIIPNDLQYLELGTHFTFPVDRLPESLKTLCFTKEEIDLNELNFNRVGRPPLYASTNFVVPSLPQSLETIIIKHYDDKFISRYPSIKSLTTNKECIPKEFPTTLNSMTIKDYDKEKYFIRRLSETSFLVLINLEKPFRKENTSLRPKSKLYYDELIKVSFYRNIVSPIRKQVKMSEAFEEEFGTGEEVRARVTDREGAGSSVGVLALAWSYRSLLSVVEYNTTLQISETLVIIDKDYVNFVPFFLQTQSPFEHFPEQLHDMSIMKSAIWPVTNINQMEEILLKLGLKRSRNDDDLGIISNSLANFGLH
ncbi:hypothetical protein PPL_11484 [Heterostelium album PN500]|uniref:Uncharacterized protein n=1 Tax=Heterostelium pallidum (strain ATCC 26659 / Pp 5 / PN500) TaxID=670386 RepID=D3BTI8_HETP5|nr:hypothetical protein PPL_11484 [Heterostelium album PN500]EFA75405.1 hypothetical protein PPL_11484 [Heterostelium album PN500]|eukprot:XP_020427539.1 hypothetical protein PPL_11484 [Heterostelium album PN500]